ncbi:MAG TPA: Wzz/FepE/Etk N-terminal domain-containing protein, partial [Burkholderiaceae bacterium]
MQGPSSTLFPPGQPPATAPRTMRDLAAALYRQAGLVAVCVLVGTAASLVLYANQPRVYTSTAKVWVQTEQQGSPSFLSGIAAYRETPYPDPVNRKIETEMELMLTRTNAQAVVDKLHIRDEQLARGTLGKLRGLLGGGAAATPAASPADSRSHTVDLFLDGVSVEPLRSKTADTSSNVLEVEFQCADPALAPVALQAFLDNYLQLGAQQNRRLGETTSRVIAGQLAQAKDDLRQAEDRIVQLLVQDSGRSVSAGAGGAAAIAGASSLGAGVAAAGGLKLDLSPDVGAGVAGATPVVSALKQQTLELQLRLDEARQLYTDDAQNVRSLKSQLAGSQQRLARVVRENTQLEAELNRLERQRELAQERYVELQRKLDQIDLYLRLNPTETESRVVVDAPDHPTKAEGRKKPLVALVGPLGGLLLGLLLAGLRELGGDRLRSAREVEWALG